MAHAVNSLIECKSESLTRIIDILYVYIYIYKNVVSNRNLYDEARLSNEHSSSAYSLSPRQSSDVHVPHHMISRDNSDGARWVLEMLIFHDRICIFIYIYT